ncbi:BLOC-2 complex member HPS5 isoform X2 [Latimeria chalumnae]|uniref:Hermansky-Pudlak syndrome 5 protein homolog n=1 Tax=Latimeria chalumnae TaxID=7897 RepID=H3ATE2_LATCH|nr:PREDICTED: Hermansky-Pudlak syndrome 5 protein isoform X2 [Latimeria chalumnae]XP_014340766.1 PREDICTED: Hermansky-Pudlak syndrome 5 protein isoform X2 [Latimeria chalumnae]|eukprot:XP_014340765.1 PREDICTED: Hermansky-Pudlak syndrome 5 protein isoform X2 [Latimeria chalumnae]
MASFPVAPESYNYVLAEFDSLDPLMSALRLDSSRLRCTCVAVTRKWLALGSSAGGLHLIQKEGWKQRFILTHKEGAICRVSCCPQDEDYVAIATSQGLVVVWELNQERRGKPERVYVSSEHRGRQVTALCWDTTSLRIFVGDHLGKVSAVKVNSSKQGKAAAFVMFPVQMITTVDSRVVQLDYLDGRLLVSSLTRCYLCDTDREKFWKIGNKERDGEYGACFFSTGRNCGSQQPLIYCARPGSRMWEVNFDGEVLSTHQFKQLLSCPPLPIISPRTEPHYDFSSCSSHSIAFPKLLFLSDQYVLTWTERGVYIFIPQSVQVLLWSEIRDIQDISVYKNELFCLHMDGRLSHLCLLPIERCVERLLKRDAWYLAAWVCCVFQHSVISSRARKFLSVDKLEHLKGQLDSSTQRELIGWLEDVISKLEPFDSACSSRRSSISSHESFNVLDCGIYRVISRRGSQSDEDSSSLHSQTLSEDERMREFTSAQEEEQVEQDNVSHSSVNPDGDRSETLLPFHIPLSFRSTSPRVSLQAVKDSVSSFVRKTTEKIGTLHMPSDLRVKPEVKDDDQQSEITVTVTTYPQEQEADVNADVKPLEEDKLQELTVVTAEAIAKLQDPLVLFETDPLRMVLQGWLLHLGKTFFSKEDNSIPNHLGSLLEDQRNLPEQEEELEASAEAGKIKKDSGELECCKAEKDELPSQTKADSEAAPDDCYNLFPPFDIAADLLKDLRELTTLCFELRLFEDKGETGVMNTKDASLLGSSEDVSTLACRFMRNYFFLLHLKRVKQCITDWNQSSPSIWQTYIQGLKELTFSDPVTALIEEGDLLNALKLMRNMEPSDCASLLAHATRLYEKYGEAAFRSLVQFYPSIQPTDIMQLCNEKPAHFLAYIDNLVKWKPENQRSSFLKSLLRSEALKLNWLQLAISNGAPHREDTVDAKGNPRARSHLFTWGYSQLILLLIELPADFETKNKITDICKYHGFWTGYLSLCLELERRIEAFTVIVYLDDMSLLDGQTGLIPQTLDEWKFLLQLAQSCSVESPHCGAPNGNGVVNGNSDWPVSITVENVALTLAKTVGPDRALSLLQECNLTVHLSERFQQVCEILRIAEKRQRAVIQTMLERCDRFLWSQQA